MTYTINDFLIQSVISVLFVTIGGGVLKILFGRVLRSLDKDTQKVSEEIYNIRKDLTDIGKDIVRLQGKYSVIDNVDSQLSNIDKLRVEFLEKFQRKPEFNRQMQIFTSQLESIFKKIDHLDDKLDKIKDRKRNHYE